MSSLVSCVIPTYKRSDTLGRAIDSILFQTYKNLEVLVVDDNEIGSQESIEVKKKIDSYTDQRVKLVTQPKHINGAEARNAGIRAAQGEYIAFLDDDDEWLPEKIEKQMSFMSEHPDIDGVSCLYSEYKKGVKFHSCPPYSCEDIHKKIFKREVSVFTSTVLVKKDKLIKSGLFDTSLRRHQDLQLLMDFTRVNKFDVVSEYLVKLHSDSAINRSNLERFISVKEDFFKSVGAHLEMYSQAEQRDIMASHYFDIFRLALKEKNFKVALRYFKKIGFNVSAFRSVYKRMQNKKYIVSD